MLTCLLGARFRDLYQLVPIVLQLVFLLSRFYEKKNLGAMTRRPTSILCTGFCLQFAIA